MKKYSKYLLVALCFFLLVGYNDTKEEKLDTNLSSKIILNEENASAICTVDKDYSNSEGYVMGAKFVIYTDDKDVVIRVVGQQILASNNKGKISSLQTKMENTYVEASKYGGYTYNTKISGKNLIVDTDIDYTKINLEQMAENQPKLKAYLNEDNQYTLSSIQASYMATGAECNTK